MGLIDSIFRRNAKRDSGLSFNDWLEYFSYGGHLYNFMPSYSLQGEREEIGNSFSGYVEGAYRSNGVVFACMAVRQLLFSEARFAYRRREKGRPGELFGDANLSILEKPWPNATTGDLLSRMIQDVDLAGNSYAVRLGQRVKRLRPDWVDIVLGSDEEDDPLSAELVGYAYYPGGKQAGNDPVVLLPEQVAHFAPYPDPIASYRGMSWLSPVLREIMADKAATAHKLKFFENGGTPNMMVKLDPEVSEASFDVWVAKFREQHEGLQNAYKTLFMGGGADVTVIGKDFQQMEFKVTQGAGETRIAAAAGVPPVIVGLSEGLEAATYSNYQLAMRRFADLTMHPLWRNVAASLGSIVEVPQGAELWYDARDIPALAENQKDLAEIQQAQATTMKTLIDGGYEADSVTQAVMSGDFQSLKHTGLNSVQLQPPGTGQPEPPPNGKTPLTLVPSDA